MMAAPASLVSLLQPWADFYGDSRLVQTIVTFAHVGGLLIGGGTAIAADRATLRMASDVDRHRHLLEVSQLHRVVVQALGFIILSGVLLATADLEAFWSSPVYWVKLFLVVLLLANGARMRSLERDAARSPVPTAGHWNAFRAAAKASLALWLLTTLAGVALINYA
jgi:hypothetical protein